VHDPLNQCELGDTVRIEETRRISKNKHWRLMAILERKLVADVRPIDLETDVGQEMTQPRILAAEVRAEAAVAGETAESTEEPESEAPEETIEEPEAEEPEGDDGQESEAADEPDEQEEKE
jgi:hypothetical protein